MTMTHKAQFELSNQQLNESYDCVAESVRPCQAAVVTTCGVPLLRPSSRHLSALPSFQPQHRASLDPAAPTHGSGSSSATEENPASFSPEQPRFLAPARPVPTQQSQDQPPRECVQGPLSFCRFSSVNYSSCPPPPLISPAQRLLFFVDCLFFFTPLFRSTSGAKKKEAEIGKKAD